MAVEDLEHCITLLYQAYEREFPGYDRKTFVDFIVRTLGLNRTGDLKGLIAFYERQALRTRSYQTPRKVV